MQGRNLNSDSGTRGVLQTLRYWSPSVILSVIVNFALIEFFWFLIAATEPVAAEKNRLYVHVLQNRSQNLIVPSEASPKTMESSEPKPQIAKKPVAKVKPTPPKKIAQSTQQPKLKSNLKPKSIPMQPINPVETPKKEPSINPVQEVAKFSEPTEERGTTNPPIQVQTPVVSETVPLFRLTRPPKLVDYNRETFNRFYPEEERRFGREGTVEAMILLDENGDILEVEIIKSAGSRFDEAARKVLLSKALVIEPGYIGDKPVVTRVAIPIPFVLTDR